MEIFASATQFSRRDCAIHIAKLVNLECSSRMSKVMNDCLPQWTNLSILEEQQHITASGVFDEFYFFTLKRDMMIRDVRYLLS